MQIEFELHRHLLDKESQDLMHIDVLGQLSIIFQQLARVYKFFVALFPPKLKTQHFTPSNMNVCDSTHTCSCGCVVNGRIFTKSLNIIVFAFIYYVLQKNACKVWMLYSATLQLYWPAKITSLVAFRAAPLRTPCRWRHLSTSMPNIHV